MIRSKSSGRFSRAMASLSEPAFSTRMPHWPRACAVMSRISSRTAEGLGLALQRSAHTGCLTDAAYVQLVGEGIPTMDVGFPLRYSHMPVEVCDLRDLEGLAALLEAALGGMGAGFSFARRRS